MPSSSTISCEAGADRVHSRPALGEGPWATPSPPPPSLEQLIAYHEGTLPPEQQDALQEALLHHPQSLATLLELAAFALPSQAAGAASAAPRAAAAFGRAVARGEAQRRRFMGWAALAAALLIVALGLAAWPLLPATGQEAPATRLADHAAPQPDAPIFELAPRDGRRSGGAASAAIAPPAGGIYTLTLDLPRGDAFTAYQATLAVAGGATRWQGRLRPDDFGTVTLALPASFLAPGRYHITLAGLDDGSLRPVAAYDFAID